MSNRPGPNCPGPNCPWPNCPGPNLPQNLELTEEPNIEEEEKIARQHTMMHYGVVTLTHVAALINYKTKRALNFSKFDAKMEKAG